MREIIIVFIRRAIIISSYLLPYALCKKLFYLTRMRLFSRILSEKAINQINRGGEILETISKFPNYIRFEEDFNEFSVFNMCYIADALGKALFSVSLGSVPEFAFLDFEYENYFDTFFNKISTKGRKEICYKNKFRNMKKFTPTPHWFMSTRERQAYHKLYIQFFVIRKDIKQEFEEEYTKIRKITDDHRVIGVVVRGTDYLIKEPKGHPVQPSIEELITQIRKNTCKEDFLYVATDEKRVLEKFQREFQNRIIVSQSMYYDAIYSSENKHISQFSFDRVNDKYKRGFEYFRKVYILSKCDGLISGMNGAVRVALIMKSGQYEIEKIINCGFY